MAKRGKYNIPTSVDATFVIASSVRGLTDPKKAHELVTKAIKKEMQEASLVKKADAFYKDIVSEWSKRGTDKSWVKFKAKVEVAEENARVDITMKVTGPQRGIDRFHMVDSKGRAPGALISVLGQMVNRKRMITKAFTEAGEPFDFKVTSKGKKRKRSKKSTKARFERATEEGGFGGFYVKEEEKVRGKKVMPMTVYTKKSQGPGKFKGGGKHMDTKPDGYNVEVYQGEVFPMGYTKHFLKLHITGGGNNTFRRDVKNAVNRAFTAIKSGNKMRPRKGTRLAKQRTAYKKSKGPAYTGKGNYLGRAKPR